MANLIKSNVTGKDLMVMVEQDISGLEHTLLDDNGLLKMCHAKDILQFNQEQIAQFCVKHGFYGIPTIELAEFLKSEIEDLSSCIEIGAGNGILAKYLGITATDSYQQVALQGIYADIGQSPVRYGEHVKQLEAEQAIKWYSPKTVISCWVTHKYNARRHDLGGNQWGIKERNITKKAKYIKIGNSHTHRKAPVIQQEHRLIQADWLISRSLSPHKNCIWIFDR